MNCLNCGTEMTNNQVRTQKASVTYDLCDTCGSLWLDAGELNKMAFQVAGNIEFCSQDPVDGPDAKMQPCPRCDGGELYRVRFLDETEILLRHCKACGGFWLDGSELEQINHELAAIMPVQGQGFSDFVNHVHVPYWNRQVRRRSSEVETRLVEPPIKNARLDGATTDICPSCGAQLNAYTVYGMGIEGCAACKGIWLYRDELRKLKNHVEGGSLRWLNEEVNHLEKTSAVATRRSCPKCKTSKLAAAVFGHSAIVIDWCPQCYGMWLERGEFDAMTGTLKQRLLRMRSKDIEKVAMADLKAVVTGGDESRWAELLDARAAISALVNVSIFEHPALAEFLLYAPHL